MNVICYPVHITLILLTLFCVSCSGYRTDGDAGRSAETSAASFPVERFDRIVAGYGGMDDPARASSLDSFAPVIGLMGRIEGIADGDSLLRYLSSSMASAVFQPDIESRMPDLSGIESDLGSLKEGLRRTAPDLEFPKHIYGAVMPYDQSVIVADTFVVIGLNHYLGSDYEGYGMFDDYRRRLKTSDRVALDVAEALIYTEFPYDETSESTVLSHLIYEGLVICAVRDALPGTGIDVILGYDREQMSWLQENESRIWRKLASDNMLFSVDPALSARLVAPAPSTPVINPSSPGRAGRYIGYRIADRYLSADSGRSAVDLLGARFYNDPAALVEAGYSGK